MKGFMKVCGAAALIMCIAGIILAVLAGSIRGRSAINDVVESVTGGKVHINFEDWWGWGVQFADSVDDSKFDLGDSDMFDREREILKGDIDKYNLGSDIRDMEIEVGGCRFTTKNSDDGNFYLEAEKATKFQGYVKGKTLHIKSVTSSVRLNDLGDCRITLYIPEGFSFDEAEIEMGAGVLETGGLNAKKVSLDVGAGQITVRGISASEAELSVGVGQIELYDMNVDDLSAEVGMGELVAEGEIGSHADIECAMGNVELGIKGHQDDFNYKLSGSMGNLDLGEESYSGFSQSKRIDNGAAKNMDVDCSMGNISIRFTE